MGYFVRRLATTAGRLAGLLKTALVLGTLAIVCVVTARAQVADQNSLDALAVIQASPSNSAVGVGTPVTVDIVIADVASLYGADVRFSFDPALVQVQDADGRSSNGVQILPGPLLTDQGSYFVAMNKVSNTLGTVAFALTEFNPAEPVTGTGVLFTVNFTTLAPGVSPIHFTSALLADRQGGSIPFTLQDGSITIGGGGATSSATPTYSSTPTATPTRTATATPSSTRTQTTTATRTQTPTQTTTIAPAPGPSGTPTVTATASKTSPPTATATVTQTSSRTATATVTKTDVPGTTATATLTPSITATLAPSLTGTKTPTPTVTHSSTPGGTSTVTETVTPVPTSTQTRGPSHYLVFLPLIVRDPAPSPLAPRTQTATATSTTASSAGQPPHVIATVQLPGANWVTVDSATNTVFVTSRSGDCVYPVDGDTFAVGACIAVGHMPFGLAANAANRLLYVANFGNPPDAGRVSIINMDTRQVVATYDPGANPSLVALDPVTGDAFVTLHPTGLVARFRGSQYLGNLDTGAGQAFSIALDSGSSPHRLYVGTRENPGRVRVFDSEAFPPRFITSLEPGGIVYNLAVNPATGDLYVVHSNRSDGRANLVAVYNRSGTRLTSSAMEDIGVNTFDGGGLASLPSSNNRLYVAGTECVPGGPDGCAWYHPDGGVLVSEREPSHVIYSLSQPPLQNGPFGVAVDNSRKRIYVTSKGNGGWLNILEDFEYGAP